MTLLHGRTKPSVKSHHSLKSRGAVCACGRRQETPESSFQVSTQMRAIAPWGSITFRRAKFREGQSSAWGHPASTFLRVWIWTWLQSMGSQTVSTTEWLSAVACPQSPDSFHNKGWMVGLYTHSFTNYFLFCFITGYWLQFPVLYCRTLLFIHSLYTSLYTC